MNRVEELCDEAIGLIGMIGEVKARCALFENRMDEDNPQEFYQSVVSACRRMQSDLHTYDIRLRSIYRELENYGIFELP